MSDRPSKRFAHGTIDCYQTNRCRCKKCTGVWELYTQEYRSDIYDETKAPKKPLDIKLGNQDYSERKRSGEDWN